MGIRNNLFFLAVAIVLILTGLVLGITILLKMPTGADLIALATFLLLAGGAAISIGVAAIKFGLPRWMRSIRGRLLLIVVVAIVVAIANVGFVVGLMYLSTHDLILIGSLLAFSLGLSIIVAIMLAESMTHNVRELVGTIQHIFNMEELNERVPVEVRDEIGELAIAFNAMLQRLQDSLSRERNLERNRRELITAVSHDLRTPLASIRVMIESINDGVVADTETIKRYLHTTQSEVVALGRLISDLFDYSQMNVGTIPIHNDIYTAGEIISEAIASMKPLAQANNLELQNSNDIESLLISVDYEKIQRVFRNLIENAIQHSLPNSAIDIGAQEMGNEIQVKISNTGEEIPADDMSRIFEWGYGSGRSSSSGLGLSIAKAIVEAHDGHIWVNSELPKVTVFNFTLPKADSPLRI